MLLLIPVSCYFFCTRVIFFYLKALSKDGIQLVAVGESISGCIFMKIHVFDTNYWTIKQNFSASHIFFTQIPWPHVMQFWLCLSKNPIQIIRRTVLNVLTRVLYSQTIWLQSQIKSHCLTLWKWKKVITRENSLWNGPFNFPNCSIRYTEQIIWSLPVVHILTCRYKWNTHPNYLKIGQQ